jgi:VWFA-related protein
MASKLKFILLILSIALILPAAARGQEATPSNRIVQLGVVALDAQGAPVTDFKREDFQVSDNGKPQRIAFAHHDAQRTRAMPLGPQEYSNQAGTGVPPATVVLFDLLNEDLASRGFSAKQIVQGLQHIEVPDHVYLYLLTKVGTLIPVRGVPQPADLGAAPGAWTQQIASVLDTALNETSQLRQHALSGGSDEVVKVTFSALVSLARQMSVFPGPKNIIWITQGVPIIFKSVSNENIDFTNNVRQISGDLRRANIALNPVRTVLTAQVSERATLDLFADLTGGQAYMSNEVEAAIVQVTRNARASYRIGFYPDARNWDGKFHKIKVTSGRSGVRIQAAQGYNADLAREQPIREEGVAIGWAQSSRLEISGIGLRATAKPAAGSGSLLEVHVEASDVVMQQEQDHYRGQLVAVVNRYYKDGRPPEIERLTENATAEGITLNPGVPLNDATEMIRIIVLDRATGAVGTLTVYPGGR